MAMDKHDARRVLLANHFCPDHGRKMQLVGATQVTDGEWTCPECRDIETRRRNEELREAMGVLGFNSVVKP